MGGDRGMVAVAIMSNSRSYLVTLVTLQPYSSTLVALSYSGHSCAYMSPLNTTLSLTLIQSLPHLSVNPAWS